MPGRRVGKVIGAVIAAAGAYAVYDSTRPSYQPRMVDYVKASAVVAAGVIIPQPPPVTWVSTNRALLDAALPRPEVAGVNRALNEYGVGLRTKELALFIVQRRLGSTPFEPGADLAAERLISRSFGEEYTERLEEAAAHPELDAETVEQRRKEVAVAKVGEVAHFVYGAVKATLSYGAVMEDDLGMGSYNEAVTREHIDEVEAMAKDEYAVFAKPDVSSIATTKTMRQVLHEMKGEHEPVVENTPSPPPKLV